MQIYFYLHFSLSLHPSRCCKRCFIVSSLSLVSLSLSEDVIHTVGPIAQGGVGDVERKALRSCYKNSLTAATKNAARSVVRVEGGDEVMMGAGR